MQQQEQYAPVYLPYRTFETAIQALEQGVPHKLDRSVFPSMSGAAQNAVLSAFKFLSLTDADGYPQPLLYRLVQEKEHRKDVLREVLEKAYPDLVELGTQDATLQSLRTAIGKYNAEGETARKATSFFLKAAENAGLKLSPHWTGITRQRNGNGARGKKPRNKPSTGESNGSARRKPPKQDPPAVQPGESRSFELTNGDSLTVTVSRPVISLPLPDRRLLLWLIEKLETYETTGGLDEGREKGANGMGLSTVRSDAESSVSAPFE